ncbi:MAG: hypothetical protein JO153_06180 [Solirubrobacterales bacterium]|nr:hypothetical protein [Solirubrobacterales bacterium]MBV9916076.1 hypothetical protein [Solirubrobacterales bacterium]
MLGRKIVGVLTALALAVALSACGGSSSSSDVTPAAYVKSICQAIVPFEKNVQNRRSQLDLSSITSPAQGKQALQGFLAGVVGDAQKAVTQLKNAGTPKVNNGKKISDAIVGAFTQAQTALSQAKDKAASLPTGSAQAFKTGAQSLGTGILSSMNNIGTSLGNLKSPELEQAAKKEPACNSVSG